MKKLFFLFLLPIAAFAQNDIITYPIAYEDTIKDAYFRTIVTDPYRWLENDSLPVTHEWLKEEATISEKYLNHIKKKYDINLQL